VCLVCDGTSGFRYFSVWSFSVVLRLIVLPFLFDFCFLFVVCRFVILMLLCFCMVCVFDVLVRCGILLGLWFDRFTVGLVVWC